MAGRDDRVRYVRRTRRTRRLGASAGRAQPVNGEISDRKKAVPGDDRNRLTPHHPERRTMVAGTVPVFDIIVDQREIVDQFDSGCGRNGGRRVATYRLARQQAERRTQSLPLGTALARAVNVRPPHVVPERVVNREWPVIQLRPQGSADHRLVPGKYGRKPWCDPCGRRRID